MKCQINAANLSAVSIKAFLHTWLQVVQQYQTKDKLINKNWRTILEEHRLKCFSEEPHQDRACWKISYTKQENYLSVLLYDYKHAAQNVTIWVFGTSDQGGKEVPTQKRHKWGRAHSIRWANKIEKMNSNVVSKEQLGLK